MEFLVIAGLTRSDHDSAIRAATAASKTASAFSALIELHYQRLLSQLDRRRSGYGKLLKLKNGWALPTWMLQKVRAGLGAAGQVRGPRALHARRDAPLHHHAQRALDGQAGQP